MAVALTALIALRSVGRRNEQVGVGAIENNNEGEVKGGREEAFYFASCSSFRVLHFNSPRFPSYHAEAETVLTRRRSRGGNSRESMRSVFIPLPHIFDHAAVVREIQDKSVKQTSPLPTS